MVVAINTFLTNTNKMFDDLDFTAIGLIQVTYLWPGGSDPSGAKSDGVYDYGGPDSIQALRDVIRFASGQIPDRDGNYLKDLIKITPLADNVGLYAFSHPGMAEVSVMAQYGDQLSKVGYFVGRENPTQDTLTAVEVGFWGDNNKRVLNPLYTYPDNYSATGISIDYSTIQWDPTYSDGNGQ